LGAPVKPLLAPWKNRNALALLVAAAAVVVVLAPTGLGLSTGANKETIQDPNFAAKGCTACHGGGKFTAGGLDMIHVAFTGPDGLAIAGNTYEKGKEYTINITLDEKNAKDGGAVGNHAGFNLRAAGGKLAAVAGISQVTSDGTQATHINGKSTHWLVKWTGPEDDSVVAFTLFVNDVDGSGAPDAADQVHRVDFYLTNSKGDVAGAVKTEAVEYGISLQQYWIGLIGLAGMLFIMVGGYFFLKYGNPHNSGPKDR
jgi:hypothetical protein